MIPDLDLALLRTFVTVVRTGSITAAAKVVGRTQPAVTNQMNRLERSIGRSIFGDNRRTLTLTRDGEMLLGYAQSLLELNDEVRGRFLRPELSGHVRLGVPDLYASFLLPGVLAGFARSHPRVEIELRCSRSIHVHGALQRGEIDVALVTRQPEFGDFIPIREEPLVWVSSNERIFDSKEPLPVALFPAGSVYRKHALEALRQARRAWTEAAVSDSISGLQAAVYAGLAVAVFPECALRAAGGRVRQAIGVPSPRPAQLVLQRRADDLSDASQELSEHLIRELQRRTER